MVIVGTHTQEERERRKGGWSEKERGVRGTGSRGLVNTHTRARTSTEQAGLVVSAGCREVGHGLWSQDVPWCGGRH